MTIEPAAGKARNGFDKLTAFGPIEIANVFEI